MAQGLTAGRQLAVVPELADDGVSTVYRLQVAGGAGGGGGGDASAANQTTEIARLTSIRDATGAAADTAATSDGGTFSLIALFKRSLGYLSTIATALGGTLTFRRAQNTVAQTTQALTANTPATIIPAGSYNGARVLNWTASPVYVTPGVTGTPASGAPSDYIPAAASGVPGQYEPPFAPNSGMQAVGAAAGNLTVELY